MMHLPSHWLILSASLLRVRCSANPERENLFSLDDLEKPGLVADLASTSSLSSSSPLLIGSSNVFSGTSPGSKDDALTLFENDENASPFASTDATLLSACATDQSVTDEQQSLIAARDERSCSPAPVVPLSPGTLQLFEDPLGWLERTITPTNSDESAPSPSTTPAVEPGYPGLLSPEEIEQRRRYPGGLYHNTDPIDGEFWHNLEDDDQHRHCEMYEALGYIYALCCRKAPSRPSLENLPEYYPVLEDCDPNTGTNNFSKTFLFLYSLPLLANIVLRPTTGNYCETLFDVCCRSYVSYLSIFSVSTSSNEGKENLYPVLISS